MARIEPEIVDFDRWPELRAPAAEGLHLTTRRASVREIRDALRAACSELGLRVDYPDGSASGPVDPEHVLVLERAEDFFARIAARGVVGFAEGYMAGDWSTLDLAGLIRVLVPWLSRLPELDGVRRQHAGRHGRNRKGDRASATDLDSGVAGELVALYSDETMSTSFGMFASGARTRHRDTHGRDVIHLAAPGSSPHRLDLGDAQRRAQDLLLGLGAVRDGSRVNLVPTGWGELPLRAAERGANVRCVTEEWDRLQVLGARFRAAGASESIALSRGAFDTLGGQVDAVVALEPRDDGGNAPAEVLEHASTSLRPGGRLAMQLEIGSERYAAEIAELTAWRRAYVDERSAIPLRDEVRDAFAAHHELRLRGRVEFGAHAAHTARLWRENFAGHGRDAAALGFDAVFRRMWNFHLASMEASLTAGWTDAWQLMAERAGVPAADA